MLKLMKIRPVGDELFYVEEQRDMRGITVAFGSFARGPKNGSDGNCRENQNTFHVQ